MVLLWMMEKVKIPQVLTLLHGVHIISTVCKFGPPLSKNLGSAPGRDASPSQVYPQHFVSFSQQFAGIVLYVNVCTPG